MHEGIQDHSKLKYELCNTNRVILFVFLVITRVLFETKIINKRFIFHFSNAAPKTTYMAKSSEVIEKKVFQSFLCAPSFKKEIMDLGNKGNLTI